MTVTDNAVSVSKLSDFLCRVLPSLERRINLYLNYKLFCEPPLQCSPEWDWANNVNKDTGIVNHEIVALINAMISPNRRDTMAFKLFDAVICEFEYKRLCRFVIMSSRETNNL